MKSKPINEKYRLVPSTDPQWKRFAVVGKNCTTIWFYTEQTAKDYIAAAEAGNLTKMLELERKYACQ